MTEDEMVGWNHQLNGHEFAQAPGGGEEQTHQKAPCYWERLKAGGEEDDRG